MTAASNVIAFPVDPVARLRVRLARCPDARALARWLVDFDTAKATLPLRGRGELVGLYMVARARLATGSKVRA